MIDLFNECKVASYADETTLYSCATDSIALLTFATKFLSWVFNNNS